MNHQAEELEDLVTDLMRLVKGRARFLKREGKTASGPSVLRPAEKSPRENEPETQRFLQLGSGV